MLVLLNPGGAIEALPLKERDALLERARLVEAASVPDLVRQIELHIERTRLAVSRNEFIDLDLATRVASALKAVLASYDDIASDQARALIVGATFFFLKTNDVHPDLESPLGFDDDARVLNAVLHDIGREDLILRL